VGHQDINENENREKDHGPNLELFSDYGVLNAAECQLETKSVVA